MRCCPPGRHAFGRVSATVAGVEVVVRIVCAKCRRTIQQVLNESPQDRAIYRDWLARDLAEASG